MKKIVVIALMSLLALNVYAKKETPTVYFYCVDFMHVNIYGAKESAHEFKKAFKGINELLMTESAKYDASSYLNVRVKEIVIAPVINRVDDIDEKELFVYNRDVEGFTKEEIEFIIGNLDLKETSGTGLIFIADFLDKTTHTGHYHVVFFDIATREVNSVEEVSGLAKGAGLRNYWARTILNVMKNY